MPAGRRLVIHEVDLGSRIKAGFTTRSGGISPEPWAEFNLGLNVGDSAERVLANRVTLGNRIGGCPVVFATQVHGAAVAEVEAAPDGPTCGEYDAIVTRSPGLGLGVLVADCVPILLADPVQRIVAVAHAGRAGIGAGVIGATVATMVRLGATSVRAVVGPCVCVDCYEVPEAMRDSLAARWPRSYGITDRGRPAIDLRAAVESQLVACDLADITHVTACTREDDQFYSHRQATSVEGVGTTGRFAGFAVME